MAEYTPGPTLSNFDIMGNYRGDAPTRLISDAVSVVSWPFRMLAKLFPRSHAQAALEEAAKNGGTPGTSGTPGAPPSNGSDFSLKGLFGDVMNKAGEFSGAPGMGIPPGLPGMPGPPAPTPPKPPAPPGQNPFAPRTGAGPGK